jgi:NADH oxidoreductase Hcr
MNFPLFADQPTLLCPHRLQIHDIKQETADVWTLSLFSHVPYDYQPGQFALVNIGHSGKVQRAYTLSSTPGVSPFITLTVRHITDGQGSYWLTQKAKVGDYLWLSDAQGTFVCDAKRPLLLLAAGCGVTPIMSICRDVLQQRPANPVAVFYSVRSPQDVIFAAQWRQLAARHPQLTLTLLAENNAESGFVAGRLSQDLLQTGVADMAARRVMICGPAPYMQLAEKWVKALGAAENNIVTEQFHQPVSAPQSDKQLTMTRLTPLANYPVPAGSTLLAAMEQHQLPINAACRAGVCGSCKTRVLSGDFTTTSQMTLTDAEIAEGYVLACSCQLHGDLTLA